MNILGGLAILILSPLLSSRCHRQNMGAVRMVLEVFTMNSVGHTFRFFTYAVTGLPGPAPHCAPGAQSAIFDGNIWGTNKVNSVNCGDLIFSGHMLFVLTMALAITHHRHSLWRRRHLQLAIPVLFWIMCIVQALFIIMARNHYSVDIVVATYVTPLLWHATQSLYASRWFRTHCSWYLEWFQYADDNNDNPKCEALRAILSRYFSFCSNRLGVRIGKQRASSFNDEDVRLVSV